MASRAEALAFYRRYGANTDPGEDAGLYAGLPETLPELCDLVKRLLIHPAEIERYADVLPEGRTREDAAFYSVADMLKELAARDSKGLTVERAPGDRLVLSCRYHAMLLVSMLKHQGVPARVRVGFAQYVAPHQPKHFDHWIAQVWNDREGRWMFVDPDLGLVDLEGFELAGDVWQRARRGEVDPAPYGFHIWWGLGYVLGNLCHDLFSCVSHELIYWEGPDLFHLDVEEFTDKEWAFVDWLAELLRDPDHNLEELMRQRAEHPLLQNVRGAAPAL